MNADLLLTLLISLISRTQTIATTLGTAGAEGRDVSDAEIDAAFAGDDVERTALQKQIDDARKGPP